MVFVFPSSQEQNQNQEKNESTKASIKLYKLLLCFCVSKLTISISSKARSAHRQPLQLLANPALSSLKLWTAIMIMTLKGTTVAAFVIKTSLSLVFLTTQLLVLDFGREHHSLFVLMIAAALGVSGDERAILTL